MIVYCVYFTSAVLSSCFMSFLMQHQHGGVVPCKWVSEHDCVRIGCEWLCVDAGNNRLFMACRRGPIKFVKSVGSFFSGILCRNDSGRQMHAADAIEQRVRLYNSPSEALLLMHSW